MGYRSHLEQFSGDVRLKNCKAFAIAMERGRPMEKERSWQHYAPGDFTCMEERYQTPDGEWLFLHEHPVTGQLSGVPLSQLDSLRRDFAFWLREQLYQVLQEPTARWEKLERAATFLYQLLCRSPAAHPWLALPADSRPQRNRSTVAYHSLLVSAFACAMAQAWVFQGKAIRELLRFQPSTSQEEVPVELPELMHFIRVSVLCHDFGKHPPQRHNARGKEQVQELFAGLLLKVDRWSRWFYAALSL
jgi:hypothetical protein